MATIRPFFIMPVVRLVDILFGGTYRLLCLVDDMICFELKRLVVVESEGVIQEGRGEGRERET